MTRWNRSIIVVLFLATPAWTVSNAQTPTEWVSIESEHFLLYTDADFEKGVRLLEDFEGRYRVFSEVFYPSEDRTEPIRVVLIDSRSDFLSWLPEALALHRKAAYLLQGPVGPFVLARDSAPESIVEDVGHSLGHLFLSRSVVWYPFWLQEAVGEYIRRLGRPPSDESVSADEAFSLADLLTIVPSADYDDLTDPGAFRQQSYRLLRVLMEDRADELHRYLSSLEVENGFDSTPNVEYGSLENEVLTYKEGPLPFAPSGIDVENRPVVSDELNALLGDLALTMGRDREARDYYGTSGLEPARVGLAILGREQPAARQVFERLIEDFPDSGLAYFHLGTLPSPAAPDGAAQIAALERAVELMPRSGRARAELALRYALEGRMDPALPLIDEALQLEPQFGDRFYEILAEVEMRRGNFDRAAECVQIAAALPHLDSDPQVLEHYDRLVFEFFRKMESYRRAQEADRLEELKREVEALVEEVDPRPVAEVEDPAPIGRVAYAISPGARGVTEPKLIEAPMPDYSSEMRRQRLEGRVVVEVALDRRGRISSTRVLSSESPELSDAVLDAVSQWRLEPARRGFESTEYSFRLTVNFYLE